MKQGKEESERRTGCMEVRLAVLGPWHAACPVLPCCPDSHRWLRAEGRGRLGPLQDC